MLQEVGNRPKRARGVGVPIHRGTMDSLALASRSRYLESMPSGCAEKILNGVHTHFGSNENQSVSRGLSCAFFEKSL